MKLVQYWLHASWATISEVYVKDLQFVKEKIKIK